MDFRPNMTPIEVIKKKHLEEFISEIFILVLPINYIKTQGNNLAR